MHFWKLENRLVSKLSTATVPVGQIVKFDAYHEGHDKGTMRILNQLQNGGHQFLCNERDIKEKIEACVDLSRVQR